MVAAPMTISIMGIVPAAGGGSSLPIGRPAVDVVAVGVVMTVVTIGAGVRRTPLSSSRPASRTLACVDPFNWRPPSVLGSNSAPGSLLTLLKCQPEDTDRSVSSAMCRDTTSLIFRSAPPKNSILGFL